MFYFINDIKHYLEGYTLFEIIVLAIIIGPIVEEVVFRGYIQTIFGFIFRKRIATTSFWIPIIITAVLFSSLHLTAAGYVNQYQTIGIVSLSLLLGLLSGYYKEKYMSLGPSINLHISTNIGAAFASVILILLSPNEIRKISESSNKRLYVFDIHLIIKV